MPNDSGHARGGRPRGPGEPLPALPAQVSLPAIEHEVLARWNHARTFDQSLKQTEGGTRWTFFEGPPTANGMPGVHHIEARVFKDLFPRYKTMRGFHVLRKAGWDCHGLPVEVAVEKELGISGKRDIEDYGIAEFNERCRECPEESISTTHCVYNPESNRLGIECPVVRVLASTVKYTSLRSLFHDDLEFAVDFA